MSEAIKRINASIKKLHGGEREQVTKYRSFMAWQVAQRQIEHGQEPSVLLKKDANDAETESR